MDENIHQDWLNKSPWYNTSICSKLHGSMFGGFITQAITYRYNLMCSLVAHERLQLYYKVDERSTGDRDIHDDATIKTLEALRAIIDFIDVWLKLLCKRFDARYEAYINAMKFMFRKIPQIIKISLNPKQEVQKLMTDIDGEWYMEKLLGDYHH